MVQQIYVIRCYKFVIRLYILLFTSIKISNCYKVINQKLFFIRKNAKLQKSMFRLITYNILGSNRRKTAKNRLITIL